MEFNNFKNFIEKVNNDLGKDFCNEFQNIRKELKKAKKTGNKGQLFKYDNQERNWSINEGGGTEVQYSISIDNSNIMRYGIGFNAQYVKYANAKSPVEYIKPYINAFLSEELKPLVEKMEKKNYEYIDLTKEELKNIQYNQYCLFGKKIEVTNNYISDEDYKNMINDIKGDLFKLYIEVFETKNKLQEIGAIEKMKNEIKELLHNNYNLILTGAPGTGKTYLAHKLVKELINKENGDEKEQKGFVQFHPSYDYTDFVEGIRPKKDYNGFERVDGIFKEFCKRAVKNIIDSSKDTGIIRKEEIIKKYLYQFLDKINDKIEEKGEYEIHGIGNKKTAPIIDIEYDNYNVKFYIGTETKAHNINRSVEMFIQYYLNFENYLNAKLNNTNQISNFQLFLDCFSNVNIKGRATYIHGILNSFYEAYSSNINEEYNNNNQTGKKIARKHFYFIIDEINRGDINKILGELFYSLDMGYRGEEGKVKTQYQNMIEDDDIFQDGFYIPENVFIIGTMNDIDRSVESMDFAIRRRFAWKEIKACDTMEEILNFENNDEVKERMTSLNKKISEKLGSMYEIGGAYFKKIEYYKEDYNKLWENHIKGVLEEYLRGNKEKNSIMEEFQQAYNLENKENSN